MDMLPSRFVREARLEPPELMSYDALMLGSAARTAEMRSARQKAP